MGKINISQGLDYLGDSLPLSFFFFLRSVRFFVVIYDYFVSFSYKRRFMDDANERRQRHIFCWSN